jgi:hypothetical protein
VLIRFVVNNVLSFGKSKEFNMLPSQRLKRLENHKYSINNFKILKMASIYGANGAGKSNLIESIAFLKNIVKQQEIPKRFKNKKFKFSKSDVPQVLAIEFFNQEKAFYYAIEIDNDVVLTEELYFSGLGITQDKLIYERKTDKQTKVSTIVLPNLDNDEEGKVLKKVIENNLTKSNETILKLLVTMKNPLLKDVEVAFEWFEKSLQIIKPHSKPITLAYRLDSDSLFKTYAEDIMSSFSIGIDNLKTEKKTAREYFGEDDIEEIEALFSTVEESLEKTAVLRSSEGDEIVITKENDEFYIKTVKLEHRGSNGVSALFDLDEESDGTIRLLDFIPAFHDVINKNKVYIVDEIERSIHPLLIKELINKFSKDKDSLGQLIFTTHESNLLDQDIFRQDEIWFAEKDSNGCTDIYPLSDFKEHATKDIRRGYLSGRYGSIPFLGNLTDLNWHKHVNN